MSKLAVHFSSKSDDWGTPPELFDKLNAEFHFDFDACASLHNCKVANYATVYGLGVNWMDFKTVWCNPPYGRGIILPWVRKAYVSANLSDTGTVVVMLLPSRTDQPWYHTYIWDDENHTPRPGVEIRFLRGRLKFDGAESGAPFPSMIVIFRPL